MERERACDTLQNLRGRDLFSETRVVEASVFFTSFVKPDKGEKQSMCF